MSEKEAFLIQQAQFPGCLWVYGQALWVESGGDICLSRIDNSNKEHGAFAEDGDYYYDGGHSFSREEARAMASVLNYFADHGNLEGFKDSAGALKRVKLVTG